MRTFALVTALGLALAAHASAADKTDKSKKAKKADLDDLGLDLDMAPVAPPKSEPKKSSSSTGAKKAPVADDLGLDLDLAPVTPVKADPKRGGSAPAGAAGANKAAAGDDLDLEMTLPPPAPSKGVEQKAAPAPAPTPVPQQQVQTPAPAQEKPAQPEQPAPEFARLRLTPAVSFGYTSEPAIGGLNTPQFGYGLSAEIFFKKQLSLQLGVKDQLYQRTYLTRQPDLGAADLARADLDEHQLSAELLFAYDFLHHAPSLGQRLSLTALVGPSLRVFFNDALRSQAGAVAVGGRLGVKLSEQLDVAAGGTWGYNLLQNEGLQSAVGGPLAVSSLDAAVGLKLAPGTRFRLAYEGEIVTLAASYRYFHSLGFLFDVLF